MPPQHYSRCVPLSTVSPARSKARCPFNYACNLKAVGFHCLDCCDAHSTSALGQNRPFALTLRETASPSGADELGHAASRHSGRPDRPFADDDQRLAMTVPPGGSKTWHRQLRADPRLSMSWLTLRPSRFGAFSTSAIPQSKHLRL
jgi:hypothetical protein